MLVPNYTAAIATEFQGTRPSPYDERNEEDRHASWEKLLGRNQGQIHGPPGPGRGTCPRCLVGHPLEDFRSKVGR